MFVELAEFFITGLALLIDEVVTLGPAVPVEVIRVINESLHSSFKNDDIFLLCLLVSVDEYVHPTQLIILDRKRC